MGCGKYLQLGSEALSTSYLGEGQRSLILSGSLLGSPEVATLKRGFRVLFKVCGVRVRLG